jgi:hypothetical protein
MHPHPIILTRIQDPTAVFFYLSKYRTKNCCITYPVLVGICHFCSISQCFGYSRFCSLLATMTCIICDNMIVWARNLNQLLAVFSITLALFQAIRNRRDWFCGSGIPSALCIKVRFFLSLIGKFAEQYSDYTFTYLFKVSKTVYFIAGQKDNEDRHRHTQHCKKCLMLLCDMQGCGVPDLKFSKPIWQGSVAEPKYFFRL